MKIEKYIIKLEERRRQLSNYEKYSPEILKTKLNSFAPSRISKQSINSLGATISSVWIAGSFVFMREKYEEGERKKVSTHRCKKGKKWIDTSENRLVLLIVRVSRNPHHPSHHRLPLPYSYAFFPKVYYLYSDGTLMPYIDNAVVTLSDHKLHFYHCKKILLFANQIY